MSDDRITKAEMKRYARWGLEIGLPIVLLYGVGLVFAGVAFGIVVIAELRTLNDSIAAHTKATKELLLKVEDK